jgi:hypothetical protein
MLENSGARCRAVKRLLCIKPAGETGEISRRKKRNLPANRWRIDGKMKAGFVIF